MRKILCLILIFSLTACKKTLPKECNETVEDLAKYNIAISETYYEVISKTEYNSELKKVIDEFEDLKNEIKDLSTDTSFKEGIKKAIYNWDETDIVPASYVNYLKAILKKYESTNPIMSKAELIKNDEDEEIWKVKELNTDLEFIITVSSDGGYTVKPLDKSYEKYIENLFK